MKIIQITDTHLFSSDELTIFGVKSNSKFNEVIKKINDTEIHDTDIIFLTGDISQDETPESYKKAAKKLSTLNVPIYWIPGNHDDTKQMKKIFSITKNFNSNVCASFNHWQFIFLNTKLDGTNEGYLSQSELIMLKNQLAEIPADKKIVIVMHHHPAAVGTPLIDQYILQNKQAFWDIVIGTNVELIICGHVHGDYRFEYNNIKIESSPATCLQWEKGCTELIIDKKIGYKVYYFNQDGYESIAKIW